MNAFARLGSLGCLISLAATAVPAQTVQIAPFAGYQFGGGFYSPAADAIVPFEGSIAWGGTLDLAIGKTWRLEALFSKQPSEALDDALGVPVELAVERYMVGLQEEKGAASGERTRYFGSILLGQTRFVPSAPGFEARSAFSVALGLGIKTFPTRNLGLRFEARGYYTGVDADGDAICSDGQCLFRFGDSFWQADLSAGLILAF